MNVAAAAYAATSAGDGVIEAEFAIRSFLRAAAQPALRHREWLDAATGRRREQTIGPGEKVQTELALSPGWTEIWSTGPTAAGTIFRFKDQTRAEKTLKPNGLEFYRQLYQGGAIKLVGRQALDGRLLWKLEGDVGFTQRRRGARLQPVFGEVILVDPITYLPVIERQVDLTRAGHPAILETRLIHYRRVPQGPTAKRLVLLSAAHRGAPTISSRVFVPLHVARAQAERRLGGPSRRSTPQTPQAAPRSRRPSLRRRGSRRRRCLGACERSRRPPGSPASRSAGWHPGSSASLDKTEPSQTTGAFTHWRRRPSRTLPTAARRTHRAGRGSPRALRAGRGPSVSSQGVPASGSRSAARPPEIKKRTPTRRSAPKTTSAPSSPGRSAHPPGASPTRRPKANCTRSNSDADGAYLIVARANPRLDQGGANVSGPAAPTRRRPADPTHHL